jgi:hypothetical protein
MNRYNTGSNANLPFQPWTIEDIYAGCGVFWKYEI